MSISMEEVLEEVELPLVVLIAIAEAVENGAWVSRIGETDPMYDAPVFVEVRGHGIARVEAIAVAAGVAYERAGEALRVLAWPATVDTRESHELVFVAAVRRHA